MQRRGMIIILSSPSGTGKSTLSHMLRQDESLEVEESISVTTRAKRSNEQNCVDYHFVSEEEFKHLIDKGAFLEWAHVHGHYYGSLQKTIDESLHEGQDIIFDIDYQGAMQIQKKCRKDAVSIFILPPSMKELHNRLTIRAENSSEDIALRLHNAVEEMRHWSNYDYILVNEELEKSFASIKAIITAERLRRQRQPDLKRFINGLINAVERDSL